MASVNKVILIGNLGRDPEIRYAASGSAICNLTLATSRQWKDRNTGERQEETEWHRVVLYDRLAEIAGEYLRKGSSCYIEGRMRTRKWQDKEGIDRYTTEIIAESMKLLSGRSADSQPPRPTQSGNSYAAAKEGRTAPNNGPAEPEFEDSIPF